jgi:hypothetical protein
MTQQSIHALCYKCLNQNIIDEEILIILKN